MQTLINEFNKALAYEDLFTTWQDEIQLRGEIRNTSLAGEGVQIENLDEFNFLKRSLYFDNKQAEFFFILFKNMQNSSVLHCVLDSTSAFKAEFFHHLINYLLDHKPHPNDMLFLINMYQEELHASFAEVIGTMDNGLCSYLLPRTTNQSLRKLIKARQNQLAEKDRESPHLRNKTPHLTFDYPTLFGDKIQIINKAIKSLNSLKTSQSDGAALLLESAELLYSAGLLTDCMAIMAEMVKYQENRNVYLLSDEDPYHQQIRKMLRKSLPIYTLLAYPTEPHRYALDLYRNLFLGFNPDSASLIYLDIYSIVSASLQGYRSYTRYELAQKAARILNYRPDDEVAQILQSPSSKVSNDDIAILGRTIVQRTKALPHESLAIMELLRLWQQEGNINLDQESATSLFKQYQHLFNWIPSSFFINEHLLKQLGPLTDESARNAGKQIVTAMQAYSQAELSTHDNFHQYKYVQGNSQLTKQLHLSRVMGVL